jgi:type IX secretion system substrate protein
MTKYYVSFLGIERINLVICTKFKQKNMMQKLLLFSFFLAFSANAQTPIFNPSMTIVEEGYVSSPSGEEVWGIIDGDIFTKFLDFDYFDGLGFTVDLGGVSATANSIEFTTANDSEGRDPMNYEILGSNDGGTFTSIATGSIPCVFERYLTRTFNFTNTTAYTYYRVMFTDQCSSDNSIQIAEVQLKGTVLGTDDATFKNESILIYPNPTKGNFFVKQNGFESIDSIHILDTTGKVVKDVVFGEATNFQEINMEGVASGIYFAKIESKGTSVIKKLVVN